MRWFALSKASQIWIFFILSAAFYMRQVLNLFNQYAGRGFLPIVIWTFFVLACLVAVRFALKDQALMNGYFWLSLVSGLIAASFLEITEERVHLVKFGILGWLLAKDSKSQNFPILAIIIGSLVATVDESVQALLPYRVGDIRDVAFGALGSIWGALTYYSMRFTEGNKSRQLPG